MPGRCRRSFSRAPAINPGYTGAYLNRGVVQGLDRNDYAAALVEFQRPPP